MSVCSVDDPFSVVDGFGTSLPVCWYVQSIDTYLAR
jgi:hypothetical protein